MGIANSSGEIQLAPEDSAQPPPPQPIAEYNCKH